MKTLFAKCTVELTTDEVQEINDLIIRQQPIPIIDKGSYTQCPVCKSVLIGDGDYCHRCGQRVDKETAQL